MFDFFWHLFDTSGFPPRWNCGSWTPGHGWLHILSDLAVWSAYFAIPCILVYFVLRRRDVPFPSIFWLFGAFILACGTTHLMEAIIFWHPVYRLAGVIKLLPAIVSWGTVAALVPIIPKALAMRSPEELEQEIAARRQAEDALQRTNDELETRVLERTEALKEADRHKDRFLATLAHELRNPLAPIRNAIDLIQQANGNADVVQRASQIMERQVGQMVRLVDDLLDLSRITQGKVQLRKEQVELAAVVKIAVESSRSFIEAQGHELTVTLSPDSIYLDADPTRLAQVFVNILDNAAKYMEKGGHIWLTVERQGKEAVVSVRDTGIGIAAEHLPHLFEMFSQVALALERSQGGLGIGLSLVRGLVELHGGQVEARSGGIGKGSEFIVRLPAVEGLVRQKPQQPETDNSFANIQKRRILAVDDNRDTADSLGLMLQMMGHEVRTAYGGLAAVQVAATFRPEVILLDIGMPELNGYEVARQIRQQLWGKEVTVIALTGWGQEEDKRRALEAGFDYHLTKPVEGDAVQKLLAGLRGVR